MKRIILVCCAITLISFTILWAAGMDMDMDMTIDSEVGAGAGAMSGVIANPAAVKIANPDGQNISLN